MFGVLLIYSISVGRSELLATQRLQRSRIADAAVAQQLPHCVEFMICHKYVATAICDRMQAYAEIQRLIGIGTVKVRVRVERDRVRMHRLIGRFYLLSLETDVGHAVPRANRKRPPIVQQALVMANGC